MRPFKSSSIHHKLIIAVLCTSLLGLGMVCAAFEVYERQNFRRSLTDELTTLADTIGANSVASLTFDDRKSARDLLAELSAEHHIVAACLYDSRGTIFCRIPEARGRNYVPNAGLERRRGHVFVRGPYSKAHCFHARRDDWGNCHRLGSGGPPRQNAPVYGDFRPGPAAFGPSYAPGFLTPVPINHRTYSGISGGSRKNLCAGKLFSPRHSTNGRRSRKARKFLQSNAGTHSGTGQQAEGG